MNAAALEIARAVREGQTSASEVLDSTLAAIARVDPQVNAFTAVTGARARAEARAIDERRARGAPLPPLAGVPYAVKNLFDVAGVTTLAGSSILAESAPATADAALIERMHDAGAVLVGTLNMDEFAYGFTTENSHHGPTRNPHDLSRIAGGSSGGSGAAVSARMVPLALASDTNGSIRVPASLCGVWGLKPTFGRLSRHRAYPFVSSLDHVGPLAASLPDLAACYDALQGHDPRDAASVDRPPEPVSARMHRGVREVRMARLGGYFAEHMGAEARAAVDMACDCLRITTEVELPDAALGRAAAFIIAASEGGNLHLDDLRERYEAMEPLSRDRFAAGAITPAAWYLQAQRIRARFRSRVHELFDKVDVLITAATPCAATPIGAEWLELPSGRVALRPSMGMLTQPLSCIGLPVVVAPVAVPGARPIGIQVVAAPWREDLCFRVAAALSVGAAVVSLPPVHA